MNKISQFRMIMAEQGIEMTIDQAKKTYTMAKSIVKNSKKMSTIDLWEVADTDVPGFSKEEREDLVRLYQAAKEL